MNIVRTHKKASILLFGSIILFCAGILFLLSTSEETIKHSEGTTDNATISDATDEILPEADELTPAPKESKPITVLAVGDLMLSRNVGNRMNETEDYYFPIENTKELLRSADITFGNLECPICEGRKIGQTEMMFRADPVVINTLQYGGFDILSLANNHTMNFGGDCLNTTFDILNDNGIDYVGAGRNFTDSHKPLIKEMNGTRIAFLAYNDTDVVPDSYFATENSTGTNEMDAEQLTTDIRNLQTKEKNISAIIVSMHSGTEYTPVPNSRQVAFAHAAIDAGADIVIGHHPHVVQHIEQYKGKHILYSLGNFIFDQMRWEDCTKEIAARITISNEGIKEVEIIPIRMKNFVETTIVEGEEKQEILEIINFETEKQPYITYQHNDYVIQHKDVLADTTNTFNPHTTYQTEKYLKDQFIQKEWIIDDQISFNAIQKDGRLYLIESGNESVIWSSDPDWIISDFEFGDIDNNGTTEMLVAFWRIGDYGKQLDNLEIKRGNKLGSHLFVYSFVPDKDRKRYFDKTIRLTWGGSTVDYPIVDFEIADLDNDQLDEIIVLEGTYQDFDADQLLAETLSIWKWNGWGFSNEYRSKKLDINSYWVTHNTITIK